MGSLRSSAQAHDLGHLANEFLPVNRNQSSRGADERPAERFGAQVVQIQGAADSGSPRNPWVSWGGEPRSERIQHTRSEERRRLLGGPRLRGMARGRWAASGVPTKPASWGGQAPKIRTGFWLHLSRGL